MQNATGHVPLSRPPVNLTASDILRFWSKVDKRGPDECWLWKASPELAGKKLNVDQVLEIRRLRSETNMTYAEIGARFGVGESNVYAIVKRKVWKRVP